MRKNIPGSSIYFIIYVILTYINTEVKQMKINTYLNFKGTLDSFAFCSGRLIFYIHVYFEIKSHGNGDGYRIDEEDELDNGH